MEVTHIVRPPLNDLLKHKAYILCPCGHMLKFQEETADHWARGHFDSDPNWRPEQTYNDWAKIYARMDTWKRTTNP